MGDQRGLIAGHRLDGGANEVIVGASQHSGPVRRQREGEAVERQAEADSPTFDVCFLQRPMPKEAGASQTRREELQIGNLLRRKVPLRKLLEIEARIDALDVAANLHAAREYIERKRVGAGDVELNVARNDGKFAEFVLGVPYPPWRAAEPRGQQRAQCSSADDEAPLVFRKAEPIGPSALITIERLQVFRHRRARRVHVDPGQIDAPDHRHLLCRRGGRDRGQQPELLAYPVGQKLDIRRLEHGAVIAGAVENREIAAHHGRPTWTVVQKSRSVGGLQ